MAYPIRKPRSPEEALRQCVDDLGGFQMAGVLLRPEHELEPDVAGRWLSACLNAEKRDKLDLRQILKLFREASRYGRHEGFEALAELCGYKVEPILPEAKLVQAMRDAEAARLQAMQTESDLRQLMDNPRLLALMESAGLNMKEVAP